MAEALKEAAGEAFKGFSNAGSLGFESSATSGDIKQKFGDFGDFSYKSGDSKTLLILGVVVVTGLYFWGRK